MPKATAIRMAVFLVGLAAAPVIATAQPVELSPGQDIVVIMGSGTSIPAGTRLSAKVIYENAAGLRFSTPGRGMFYVKWGHILRVGLPAAPQVESRNRKPPRLSLPRRR
ncbi:MAG: hypothetical protein ACYCPQ_01300 [Elusimicrobiota bacterium]